jgi:hypothetical protein
MNQRHVEEFFSTLEFETGGAENWVGEVVRIRTSEALVRARGELATGGQAPPGASWQLCDLRDTSSTPMYYFFWRGGWAN